MGAIQVKPTIASKTNTAARTPIRSSRWASLDRSEKKIKTVTILDAPAATYRLTSGKTNHFQAKIFSPAGRTRIRVVNAANTSQRRPQCHHEFWSLAAAAITTRQHAS